ncbi:TadE/TadG family type IV pilus assembly protein [Denitrobaculum tricleocarpae]|uniref:Pilus assembly protein n=1 Tax=Denitrobaculum tricleocarpae TaxID=2591009 RepID=A0A545TP89_9PROT|nr:TadE/TadG family type IV pilus assembly protein [Denitrobaculum tricleocarpae]TQV79039.1 pilus assembly protein [Denitrobaculum tricleocarpae]
MGVEMNAVLNSYRLKIARQYHSFVSDRSGVTIIEFAFIVPVILFMLLGMFDMGRYMLLNQKLDRAAATMSDLTSRPSSISAAEINQLMIAAIEVVQPFDLASKGGVIVSSVYKNPGDPAEITWQIQGAGPTLPPSLYGGVGDPANMPAGFVVRDNENVITAEVYFRFEPVFLDFLSSFFDSGGLLPEGVIVQTALRQPRLGDLSTLSVP